jgi:hypothetical protein
MSLLFKKVKRENINTISLYVIWNSYSSTSEKFYILKLITKSASEICDFILSTLFNTFYFIVLHYGQSQVTVLHRFISQDWSKM